jgi:2-methylisocitrate lyase-like PEP mutase family enzyme
MRELAAAGVARISTGSLLFRVALGAITAAARGIRDARLVPEPGTPSYDEVAGLP